MSKSKKSKKDRVIPKLGFGPMSNECIEAIYEVSEELKTPLMMIASRNQVDFDSGYVCDTKTFAGKAQFLSKKHPGANVLVCRDHLGLGFKDGEDAWDKVDATLDEDVKCGFDVIHLDFSKGGGPDLNAAWIAEHCNEYHFTLEDTLIEVGLTEIGKPDHMDLAYLIDLIRTLKFTPEFISTRTGTHVKDGTNIGVWDEDHCWRVHYLLNQCGIRLKEHNADFLTMNQLMTHKICVDAMNIAPQLGTVQTSTVRHYANMYGLHDEYDAFSYMVAVNRKWEKWITNPDTASQELCCLVAGHYHFHDETYHHLLGKLLEHVDIIRIIKANIKEVICHYIKWFG